MDDKDIIRAEIVKRIEQIKKIKEEYEMYEVWGEVPQLRGKLDFAYNLLIFIDNMK